jgi:hypothetical protein
VPELGKDPLEEFKEILNDPLGENSKSDDTEQSDREGEGKDGKVDNGKGDEQSGS